MKAHSVSLAFIIIIENLNAISSLGSSKSIVDLSNQIIGFREVSGRSLCNETVVQGVSLGVQVLDIGLDNSGGKKDSIKLRLLGNNGLQSSNNIRNKVSNNGKNSISFFSGDGRNTDTTVGTSLLEACFEDLFLVVDRKSTSITSRTSVTINLYVKTVLDYS